jgi:hypothetical protein
MTAYRKKPVVIEATQWFKSGDHPAVEMKEPPYDYGVDTSPIPWIKTLEGGHIVTPGDWVITGVKGEHYPCKPDIFEATYELAATPASPQAPAPQAVVGEASERLKRMGRLAEKIHEMASGIKDYVTSRDIGESALALMIDIQAECRATPTPAPSAALHQGADALREATFDDWWYGHDGVRQRQVAYLGWPCTKELAETIWNGARAALSQHQAPKDDPENDLTAYERWHGI